MRHEATDGESEAELLVDYPQLAPEDVRAALAYGATMSREKGDPGRFEVLQDVMAPVISSWAG